MLGTKRICRVRIAKEELEKMSKEDFHKSWLLQEQYVDYIEAKLNENTDQAELANLRESEEKLKQQQLEATRRENILVMRLTTKEQEMQEYAAQIQELKQSQIPTIPQLRSTLLDPAVNLMFDKMRKEIETLKAKLEETQNELSAWKFTPDSNTGKRLMAKCRLLYQENEELGKIISSGRMAKMEGDLALQKTFSEEMKKTQSDLDEFLLELDEDVEGMQATIYYLQVQLRESKDQILKLQKENEKLLGLSINMPVNNSLLPNDNTEMDEKPLVSHVPQSNTYNVLGISNSGTPSVSTPVDLNRTEGMLNPAPDKGTNSGQPWSPPPHKESNVDYSHTVNLTVEVDPKETQIKVERVSPKLRSQQSKHSQQQDSKPIENTLTPVVSHTVTSARGSLHMEEYDSEQEVETPNADEPVTNKLSLKTANSSVKPVTPSVNIPKVEEPSNKRTSENGSKTRKRTRSTRSRTFTEEEPPCELPAVKRLRRRDIVVEKDVSESEQKRTHLPIDADTDVLQVAQTLAGWAATKQERKDIHMRCSQERLSEALGNGEVKGGANSKDAS